MERETSQSERRRYLRGLLTWPLLLLPQQWVQARSGLLPPTPEDDWGPFYPGSWAGEIDSDLTVFAGRAAEGQRLVIVGTVRDRSGKAMAEATIEIWQTDARGKYRHPGVPEVQRDPGFQGFGRTRCNDVGEYQFVTVFPGRYGSRPPHIHIRVATSDAREWVSQIYFAGDNREGSGLFPARRHQLSVTPTRRADGSLEARFDVVLP